MIRMMSIIALAVLVAGITGCDQGAAGKVAIIDMGRVARAIGRDKQMSGQHRQFQQQIGMKVQQLEQRLSKQYDDLKKKFGEKPTDEQKKQLAEERSAVQQRVNSARQSAARENQRIQYELWNNFRNDVVPHAEQAALDAGLSVVMVRTPGPNDDFLTFDKNIDITDAVIQGMLESKAGSGGVSGVQPAPVPAPPTPAPPAPKPSDLTAPPKKPAGTDGDKKTPAPAPDNGGKKAPAPAPDAGGKKAPVPTPAPDAGEKKAPAPAPAPAPDASEKKTPGPAPAPKGGEKKDGESGARANDVIGETVFIAAEGETEIESGKVAVIDLTAVLKGVGRDTILKEKIEKLKAELTQNIRNLKGKLEKQVKDEQARIGINPTAQQKAEITRMAQEAQKRLIAANQAANRELLKKQSEFGKAFRDESKPFAQKVARGNGRSIIIIRNPANDFFLAYDDATDITDEVVAAMKNVKD